MKLPELGAIEEDGGEGHRVQELTQEGLCWEESARERMGAQGSESKPSPGKGMRPKAGPTLG